MTDKVSTSLTTTGIKIEAEGGSASRLGHALADAISPFTELLGTLGDQVQAFRVHRHTKLLETLHRAHRIRRELGIEDSPVSTKFLSNWIEGASTEADEDNELTELWANLLAHAPKAFSSNHALFVDILRKIGPQEARIFQQMVRPETEVDHRASVYESIYVFRDAPIGWVKLILDQAISTPIKIEKLKRNRQKIYKQLSDHFHSSGSTILEFEIYDVNKSEIGNTSAIMSMDEGYYKKFGEIETLNSFDILKHLGLVDFETHVFDIDGIVIDAKMSAFFVGASVTPFGAKFAEACIPDRAIDRKREP